MISCNDTLDNWVNSSYFNITIDTINPEITLDAPADGANLDGTSQNLIYTPTDVNLNNCTLKIYSSGTQYSRLTHPASSGTQYTEIFTSQLFYALWTWSVNCSDFAGNSYANTATFTTYDSVTGGGGGGSSVECPEGFYYEYGYCLPDEPEEPIIDLEEIAEEQAKIVGTIKENLKETVNEIITGFQLIVRYILLLLNLWLIYKIYKAWSLRRRIKKESGG